MTAGPVVIIGAGHAGFQLAMSLRQHGFSERIALLNDEGHLPYQRPPLSKAYLKGTGGPDSLMFRPEKFYPDQNIDLISDRAVSIDRAARKVLLASGASLDYGHLVLATGARNRLLDIPNANLDSVRYLRTLDESQALARLHRSGPARRRDRRRIHRPGIRRDRAGQGPRSRRHRARAAGDGARGDRGNLGILSIAAHRGRHPDSSRRAGHQHRERRQQGHRRQPQRRAAHQGRSDRGRRRRAAQCRTGGGGRAAGRGRHHRRRASADRRSRTSRRSAIARCMRARGSAARCGWSRCRTPPTTRAASRPG